MNHKLQKKLNRNIGLDYLSVFIQNMNMQSCIWVLYLSFCGMNLGQIGILEGVYHITSMFFIVSSTFTIWDTTKFGSVCLCWLLQFSAVPDPVKYIEPDDSFQAKSHFDLHKQHVLFNWNDHSIPDCWFPGRQVWTCTNIRDAWNASIHICSWIWEKMKN